MRTSVKFAAFVAAAATMLAVPSFSQSRSAAGRASSAGRAISSGSSYSSGSSSSGSRASSASRATSSGRSSYSGSGSSSYSSGSSSSGSRASSASRATSSGRSSYSGSGSSSYSSGSSSSGSRASSASRATSSGRSSYSGSSSSVSGRPSSASRVTSGSRSGYSGGSRQGGFDNAGPGRHNYGCRVSSLPPRYTVVVYWNRPYYCWNGIYYRSYCGSYIVCRPPYGVFFDVLDVMNFTMCRIAYYNTLYRYYDIIDKNYDIIQEQNKIIAENNALIASQRNKLAADDASLSYSREMQELAARLGLCQSYARDGVEYFYDDGSFYVKNADGKYETIVPPAGAQIDALPSDFEEIILQGEKYYRVDDTVYRLVIFDGKAVFEVLGQMPEQMYSKYMK